MLGLLLTGVAAAAPSYKVVDLSVKGYPESSGVAAIVGHQAGDFTLTYYRIKCGPRTWCRYAQTHGALWSGGTSAQSVVDLNPPGYFQSTVTGMANGVQVGFGYAAQPTYKQQYHALMWRGNAKSMVDLHPASFNGSIAYATDGTVQAGSGWISGVGSHALIWFGSAASVVDLNPLGLIGSEAYAVSNGVEGGYAFAPGGEHAYIWRGTAASGRDLNPAGFSSSYIKGVDGKTEVGAVATTYGWHAYMWQGVSSKGVDLHTSRYIESEAVAASGGKQVGWGGLLSTYHAVVWSGTSGSCLDLQQFLPSNFVSSRAFAIAPDGSIFGFAQDANWNTHAVLWIPQR